MTTDSPIRLQYYAADGHTGEEGDRKILSFASWADMEAWIRIQTDQYVETWEDDAGRICYHESPAEGCGGWTVLMDAPETDDDA